MNNYGRYRLLERVGTSRLTEDFKAKSFGVEGFEKTLLVKRLRSEFAGVPEFVDEFIKLAKLAVRLSHANVVQVFDLGTVVEGNEESYYLATEYVAGTSLQSLVARCRALGLELPTRFALQVGIEVSRGLDHAHRRRDERGRELGIVHRRVNPAHIRLSYEGEIKLSDFCIGGALDQFPELDAETPGGMEQLAYFSPEQWGREALDARSDLFSLSLVLYELLTGRHPLHGEADLYDPQALAAKLHEFVSSALEPSLSTLDPALKALVLRGLAWSPEDRFQNVAEMHEQLLAQSYRELPRFGENELSEMLQRVLGQPSIAPAPDFADAWATPAFTSLPPPPVANAQEELESKPVAATGGAARPNFTRRFLGRRSELRLLGERFALAGQRRAQVLGISGAPGIGKTRLLVEMRRRLHKSRLNLDYAITACPEPPEPFGALIGMVKTLCGVHFETKAADMEALGPRLRSLGLTEEAAEAVLAELGRPLEAAEIAETSEPAHSPSPITGGASVSELSPAMALRAGVARIFASLAEERLQILVWDNVERIDLQSAIVLSGLARQLPRSRLALVFSGRDLELIEQWRMPRYTELHLTELEPEDAERLISARFGEAPKADALSSQVLQHSKAEPMLAEQLILDLLESEGTEPSLPAGSEPGASPVPDSLEALLVRRLGRLSRDARHCLETIALLQQPVRLSLLEQMLEFSSETLEKQLTDLQAASWLVLASQGASFPTTLLREAVKNAISAEAARELHARAAEVFEKLEQADQNQLALHLREAGERQAAAKLWGKSGVDGLKARRYHQAAFRLVCALECLELKGETAQQVLEFTRALAVCIEHTQGSLAIAETAERLLRQSEALPEALRSQFALACAKLLALSDRADIAENLLAEDGFAAVDDFKLAQALKLARAELLLAQGQHEQANRILDLEALGADTELGRRASLLRARACTALGEFEAAWQCLDASAPREPQADPGFASKHEQARAQLLRLEANFSEAAAAASQASELAKEAGLLHDVCVNALLQGEALIELGETARAYVVFRRALLIAETLGIERVIIQARLLIAYLEGALGVEGAMAELREGIALGESRGWRDEQARGCLLLGRLLAHLGNATEAKRELERVESLAEGLRDRSIRDDARRLLQSLAS